MAQESFDTVHISLRTTVKHLHKTGRVLGLVMSTMLLACSPPPDDETRLRQRLAQLAEAIEQHDRQTIMQQLTVDFRTTQGLLPQDINRIMVMQFRQNRQIQVFLYDIEVELMPVTADVELEALLLGSSQWLPEKGQRYQVKMRWQKLEEEWRLARMDWQPVRLTP